MQFDRPVGLHEQSAPPASLDLQRSFWNEWNATNREAARTEVSRRQAEVVTTWLRRAGRRRLSILEVGCGTGWFCPQLAEFGDVTGTDISDEVLDRARRRWPDVEFIAGDFDGLPFEAGAFDLVVGLEVLSHVPDHAAFVGKLAQLLRPGGTLALATQNRPTLERHCIVAPPMPGQLRRWVDRSELRALVEPHFHIDELFSVTPIAQRGPRRFLTSGKVNRLLRPVLGDRLRSTLEARDWGWTLMLRATRKG